MSLTSQGENQLQVENIGGIETATLDLQPGVTVLFGENASNRSSLLSAIAGVLGARAPTLKTDADSGSATLLLDGNEYRMEITRDSESVVVDRSTPPVSESVCDLFVRLLEDNPLRQSVEHVEEGKLYDLLMEPVDTVEIESEISAVKAERSEIEETLEHYDELEKRLPTLRSKESELNDELETISSEIDSLREEIEDFDETPDTEGKSDLLDELESHRSEHRSVIDQLDTRRHALSRLEDELESVEAELESVADTEMGGNTESLDAEIEDARSRKRQLDTTIQLLQSVIRANQQATTEEIGDLFETPDSNHVTDALDPSAETVECWTCGNAVSPSDIESQIEELRAIVAEKQTERTEIETRIETLTDQRDEIESRRQRRTELEERRTDIRSEINDHETTIDALEDTEQELQETIESLESEAESIQDQETNRYLELMEELNEMEYERGQVETELDSVHTEIADIEETVSDRSTLERRLEKCSTELSDLQDRIYHIERETVDTINETMDTVLTELDFDNIERIWIERQVTDETANTSRADGFTLHIVRTTSDGAAYEDTIETLSTSEREIVGIVLAVAGFLVHGVDDSVPVLLLDAIEALDAARINALLGYLTEHVPYLLATAHPEDRDAFQSAFRCLDINTVL